MRKVYKLTSRCSSDLPDDNNYTAICLMINRHISLITTNIYTTIGVIARTYIHCTNPAEMKLSQHSAIPINRRHRVQQCVQKQKAKPKRKEASQNKARNEQFPPCTHINLIFHLHSQPVWKVKREERSRIYIIDGVWRKMEPIA